MKEQTEWVQISVTELEQKIKNYPNLAEFTAQFSTTLSDHMWDIATDDLSKAFYKRHTFVITTLNILKKIKEERCNGKIL